jgi:hypothetical protein
LCYRVLRRARECQKDRKIIQKNERLFKENFPNLEKDANIKLQKGQRSLVKCISTKSTPRHLIIKFFYYYILVVQGVHCHIYKNSYNISLLNSLPPSFSFIPPPILRIISTGHIFPFLYISRSRFWRRFWRCWSWQAVDWGCDGVCWHWWTQIDVRAWLLFSRQQGKRNK